MKDPHIRISAVINTFNEEKNIAQCLNCVDGHVDEIIISDMHSTDRTLEICARFNAKVGSQPRRGYVHNIREEGVARASNEWIFLLDCDETVRPELFVELRKIAEAGTADLVAIHRINYAFGRKITGGGWPDELIERFFRKGTVHFPDHPHLPLVCQGKRVELPASAELSIEHNGCPSVSLFINKLNDYTDSEARRVAALGWQPSFKKLMLRPAKVFCQHFFLYRGYRNRKAGFVLASLMAVYWLVVAMKLWRIRDNGSMPREEAL
jgi:glycosyltransferase involved in cell wall biosynthesis